MKKKQISYTDKDWKEDLRPVIEKRADMLRREVEARKQALLKAPEGALRVTKYGNTYQYFRRREGSDTHGKYIKKRDIKMAVALAQKSYDAKFVGEAAKELKVLDEYLDLTNVDRIGNITDSMHEGKRLLITPIYKDDESFVKDWEAVKYPPGSFKENTAVFLTAKNERVRSKVEINIANMLKMYNVPYRYEYPLELDFEEKRPDFLCLNVRSRKEYIWEHFGMMDKEDYALRNINKINRYMENGFMPGDNLIMTFETDKTSLSTVLIKEIITKYLL